MLPSTCLSPSTTRLKPITSQSLCNPKGSNSNSLRSLAPLLNQSPSPPTRHEVLPKLDCATNLLVRFPFTHNQPPISPPTTVSSNRSNHSQQPTQPASKTSSLNSSSGQSVSPPTPTGYHCYSVSPTSYHAYHPEWTSASSPVLDTPDTYYPGPPRKKSRALLHSGLRSPIPLNPQDFSSQHQSTQTPTIAARSGMDIQLSPSKPTLDHRFSPIQSTRSHEPVEADDSPNPHEHHDDSKHEPGRYPHLVSLPRPLFLDDDRNISSRPLKNTKRAAQNRAAQRAFRERKDRYVRELEARSAQFEDYIVQYGLLDERERLIEAREAALKSSSISKFGMGSGRGEEGKSNNQTSRASLNDQSDYLKHLEQQLDCSRREISRLRRQLTKAYISEEEMNISRRKVMDWERGAEIEPRTRSPSDADTRAQTSCSSRSLSSSSARAPSTTIAHSTWMQHGQRFGDISQMNVTESLDDETMMRPSPTASINLDRPEAARNPRDCIRHPSFDEFQSPDSIQASSYHRPDSARAENSSTIYDRTANHVQQSALTPKRSPGSASRGCLPRLNHDGIYPRDPSEQDVPGELIRLPAIRAAVGPTIPASDKHFE